MPDEKPQLLFHPSKIEVCVTNFFKESEIVAPAYLTELKLMETRFRSFRYVCVTLTWSSLDPLLSSAFVPKNLNTPPLISLCSRYRFEVASTIASSTSKRILAAAIFRSWTAAFTTDV